jgi:nucleoside-diphosphate-sugar epimerase
MPKRILIAGASGVIGNAALTSFTRDGWDVVALSRREPDLPEGAEGQITHLAVDLRDREATAAALRDLEGITHVAYAALFEKPGLIPGWTERDQMETNDAMLRNVVDPVAESGSLEHVSILQGTKAYGIHLHPISVPAREREPRDDHENFYWLQEDYIRDKSDREGFAFTVLRPQVVVGGVYGVAMNLIPVIGAYAAICAELGEPFSFPGGPSYLEEAADARLVADVLAWAATEPGARNETFNVTNGDVFMWRALWPGMAEELGVPKGPDERRSVVEFIEDNQDTWRRITERHGLRPVPLLDLVGESHHYADFCFGYALEEAPAFGLVSTIKLRQAGFHDCYDTEDSFRYWLRDMADRSILPRAEALASA